MMMVMLVISVLNCESNGVNESKGTKSRLMKIKLRKAAYNDKDRERFKGMKSEVNGRIRR